MLWMSLLLAGLVITWLLAWSKWCWLMVVVLGINTYSVLIWYVPDKIPATAQQSLRVFLFNQGFYSTRADEIVKTIDEYQPDLIMIQEINLQTAKALNALAAYPYRTHNLRNDSRDMALWSRYPLTGIKKDVISAQSMTSIYGQLHLPQRTVPLLLVHTSSANHLHTFQLRKQEWSQMAQFVNQHPSKSWVVLGDMNTTMWSELYRGFITDTALHNSRKGFGLLPTWPTIYSGWHGPPVLQTVLNPLPGMLKRLPIDHCLVGPAGYTKKTWVVTQRELASDHFPLWIELLL